MTNACTTIGPWLGPLFYVAAGFAFGAAVFWRRRRA
jgi:hypothetical protein